MSSMPTNGYDTYAVVGIREDLSDVVYNIAPADTKFYSACGKVKATGKYHEWLTDTLRAAASNAKIEGYSYDAVAAVPAVRKYNYTQIQTETFTISSTAQASDSAGGVSTVNYQKAKRMKELAKDIEYAMLQGVVSAGATGATGRQMKGALNWCASNVSKLGASTVDGTTGVVTSAGTRDLTQDLVDTLSQDIYSAGGNPKTLLCNTFQMGRIAGFTNSGNYRQMVEAGKLNNYVDVYRNSFFSLAVTPDRGMPTDVVFLADMDYWKCATLQPTKMEQLAKLGLSDAYLISVEHTVQSCNEAASGRIVDLTTS